MDPTKPNSERTWKASHLVPFSSRMVVERLRCWGLPNEEDREDKQHGGGVKKVRVLVNDQVQPLEFCGASPLDGMCTLRKFAESQRFARGNGQGKWEQCFEGMDSRP